ncbi:hypothetical protein BKA69DRAFT_1044924 [Paraphysoderma sedebokerense]|nr:hypothetical protein BKA69DRAFT_1044924 [Paraphysoderma sedebokerense]
MLCNYITKSVRIHSRFNHITRFYASSSIPPSQHEVKLSDDPQKRFKQEMTLLRKEYMAQRPETQISEGNKSQAFKNVGIEDSINDPSKVGSFGPRRLRKRFRLLNVDEPSSVVSKKSGDKKKVRSSESTKSKSGPSLESLYNQDLNPANPRLHHLLNLFYEARHFVTHENLEEKLDNFISNEKKGSVKLYEMIDNITEFGMAMGRKEKPIDLDDVGATDVEFELPLGTEYVEYGLQGGSLVQESLSRERRLRDALQGRIDGQPGVQMILEHWQKSISK